MKAPKQAPSVDRSLNQRAQQSAKAAAVAPSIVAPSKLLYY